MIGGMGADTLPTPPLHSVIKSVVQNKYIILYQEVKHSWNKTMKQNDES